MRVIKGIDQLALVIGLVLSLLNLKGCFVADRLAFANEIKAQRECSVSHPGAKKFLKEFYVSHEKNIQGNETIIVIPGQAVRGKILTGATFLKDESNKKVDLEVSYSELNNWSQQGSPCWEWTALIVLAISIFAGIIIFVKEDFIDRRQSNKSLEQADND